jgi:hypothetical protein
MLKAGIILEIVKNVFETCPVEPERYKPSEGEAYFFVECDGIIGESDWVDRSIDRAMWSLGNCFQNHADAVRAREKIKEVL